MSTQETMALKRILVVDDEPEIRNLIVRKLINAGYDVLSANSANHALEVIQKKGLPHLAIIDINMPGMNGLELCDSIQQYVDLPVILVTAISESTTTIQAIKHYAEDYIVKPFNLDELVVRVQRLLRRINDFSYADGPLVQISPRLAVNFVQKQAFVDGKVIDLTPTETKLLHILWRHSGRIVTNEFLLGRVWPNEEVFEDTLRVHIHRLRQKIDTKGLAEKYILTERGQGYRFVV
jgi:DNA-binding response OmpR family regulator